MPGIIVDGVITEEVPNEASSSQNKENLSGPRSPVASAMVPSMQSETLEMHVENSGAGEPSIEQLYNNVCEMESSSEGGSPSRESFGSDGEESRIDSELRHLVAGEMEAVKVIEEEEEKDKEGGSVTNAPTTVENGTPVKTQSSNSSKKSKKTAKSQLESDASVGPNGKASPEEGESEVSKPGSRVGRRRKASANPQNGTEEAGLDNPDLGPFLLKHARDLIASDNPRRALKYALRATKSFEKCAGGKPSLNLVMSLHVVAAIHCNMGKYEEAVPVLQRSLEIPVTEEGQEHALAKFSGCMQLGDTYGMLGQTALSLQWYAKGLDIQKQTLGEQDPRVGETCRYLAEAHVQALQLDEAQKLCQMALDIHRDNGQPASLEETADRRLMGLICDTKGDHEAALEHLLMASMAMVSNGQETEVASVDCSIGDIYLSLGRYDEAVCAYQKALTVFKTSKGENHATVASVFLRLADLYNKTGKLRESKSYCENALKIYQKPIPGTSLEEIATGLTDVSAIYETMNEHDQALKLLQKALKMYNNSAGQQSTIAGIEAQIGVLHYISGNYGEAYDSFKSAITKLRTCGEKKSAFFGIALNQMGLACVQRYSINEAAELFEEARTVLEQEYGPYHPDTLGVYSNLAGTYDAMGRLDEAIEILEYVVGMREEKLGTANPDVDDEKRRLAELLKEAGRGRSRKAMSLENLLEDTHRSDPLSVTVVHRPEMPPAEDASAAGPPPAPTSPPTRGAAAGSRLLLQSPLPAFPLGSNDDQQERARARAMARAASVRRRSLAASLAPKTPRPNLLNRDEVMDLFHNCIKLASENKINQKNTWELGLIDHLSEIIQAGEEDDDETNFQKASCTLEAGVKIYSLRVDSVHSEAYKVLGGINRAGRGEEADMGEGGNAEPAQEEGINKKDADKRISPASTLESSFEALNVKKFDVAFTVDPLYHQTTAQFDEGGAKGLLLYNLGVYGSCRVLFDSFEAPDNCILSDIQEKAEVIDLSFAKEQIEQMILHMPLCNDISPTLRDIVAQFDEENKRPSHDASSGKMPVMEDQMFDSNNSENDDNMQPDCETWDFGGGNDQDSAYDDTGNLMNFNSTNYEEGPDEYTFQDPDGPGIDERFEKIADLLSHGMGFSSKTNAWAGPEHLKYRKVKDLETAKTSSGDLDVAKKTKKKRSKEEPDIDFTKALEHEMANVFAPPKNPKSLLLPANKGSCNYKLPEDCHYQPESLVKLFLLPDVLCLARRRRKPLDDSMDNNDDFVPSGPWDHDNDNFDEENAGVQEPVNLIAKPRQVNKIDIQYDKVSKQVDVHALKEVLWNHIHTSAETDDLEREGTEPSLCLTKVLHNLPCSNPDLPTTEISPHLYFICLLHLANEHNLKLCDRLSLDEIDIYVPASSLVN